MRWPRSDGCTMTVSSSIRAPSIGAMRLCRSTSVEHRPVQRDEHEAVHRRLGQLQAAVAAHGVDDVDQQRLRDGVAREADERVDDLLRVVPGGPGVPERERGDAIGVDVLGSTFELGERSDRRAGLRSGRMVDLEQQGLVGLDDQGPVGHDAFLPTASSPAGVCTPRGALHRKGYTPAPRTHACRVDHTGLPRPSPSPSGRVETRTGPASGRPADRPVPMRRSDGPSMSPTLPLHAPSFSVPVIHRGQSTPRLATIANRRPHVSQCGRTSSATAVSNKSRGTWA